MPGRFRAGRKDRLGRSTDDRPAGRSQLVIVHVRAQRKAPRLARRAARDQRDAARCAVHARVPRVVMEVPALRESLGSRRAGEGGGGCDEGKEEA